MILSGWWCHKWLLLHGTLVAFKSTSPIICSRTHYSIQSFHCIMAVSLVCANVLPRKRDAGDVGGGKKQRKKKKGGKKCRGGESSSTNGQEVAVVEGLEVRRLRALLVQKDETVKRLGVEIAKLKALGYVQSGQDRWNRKTMKGCDVATRSKVFDVASTYFKVMKFLPRGYERFDDKDPHSMCQQIMSRLSDRACETPDAPFYEYIVVPCLAARWQYHRSYAVDRMTKVVKGKWGSWLGCYVISH